jgi:hypothetical protein
MIRLLWVIPEISQKSAHRADIPTMPIQKKSGSAIGEA